MKILYKIAILCDLNSLSGLGHLNRMKNLSKELEKKGSVCHYLFNKSDKKYIKQNTKNIKITYFSKNNKIKSIENILLKKNFSILILDSYKDNFILEKTLVKKGIFVVSLDDHLKKHFSNIVVTNRSGEININNKTSNQIWLTGSKHVLVTKKYKKKKLENKFKKLRLLLHAGGSSSYRDIKEIASTTLEVANEYDLDLSILCTSKDSKNYINSLINKLYNLKKFKILPFIKNLSAKIGDYNIIVGPSGTTTFETILSGSIPFSAPLKNDGRDSFSSWSSIGHILHLSNKEKKNKTILRDMWSLIIKKHNKLLKILKENSKQLDGLGPKRLANKIVYYYKKNKKKIIDKNIKKNNEIIVSEKCQISDIRHFLDARNQKLVREMSTSRNVITLPEHINWWLKDDIKKYKLILNGQNVAYHWCKINRDSNGKYVTTAWFLCKNQTKKLQLAYEVLNAQFKLVRKNYKNSTWIISMKKNNKFVHRLNKQFGFNPASEESILRLINKPSEKNNNLHVMEMKI